MATSLFEKAKKNSIKKESNKTKDKNPHINIEDSEFFEKVKEYEKLNTEIKKFEVKIKTIYDSIRELSKSEWSKLYFEKQENPGTVILEHNNGDGEIGQVQFIPSDKYISINIKKAEEIKEKYGDDIISEKIVYSLDNSMIEKYGEIISKLIEDCSDIDEVDKTKIIKAEETYSISKGTIDKMSEYDKSITLILEDIKPVFSLKNIEVIKE